jgi:uncharacterized protein with HEPN domain
MLRDPRALLWDICRAADTVADFIHSKTIEDYQADRVLRSDEVVWAIVQGDLPGLRARVAQLLEEIDSGS